MKLTRRDFGRLSAGLPLAASLSSNSNPDVVVVGAGVAGMAAARVLQDGGRRVQVVEAAPRVGGRCYTDTASFGLPFDQGAMWLRKADFNPLYGFARLFRFNTALPQPKEVLFAGGRRLPTQENDAYERAYDAYSIALAEAAEAEEDRAASALPATQFVFLPDGDRAWLPTVASQIGPLDMGIDLEQLSVKDWFNRDEAEPARLVREGMGTLAARLADGLQISVGTMVNRVSMLRGGVVEVATSKGALRTRAVIITASVGVLSAGSIAIEPGLPLSLQSALNGLQMGSTLKIAFALAGSNPATAFPSNSVLLSRVDDQRAAEFLVRPFGLPMAVCSVGGSLALDLESRSEQVHHDFAAEQLRAMLGSSADKGVTARASTSWGRNPLVLGSVASAKPGRMSAREALRDPLHDSIFLAGEAMGEKAVQTVHGAYDSGRATARRVLSYLKRKGSA